MTTEKAKALELAIGQIERQFGRGAVMRLGDASKLEHAQSISTGSLALDMALGIGGIPRGRVTEVFGTEASGKSTLAYHIMAEAQRSGGTAAYIDAEHALDPIYSSKCGVDTEVLLVSQPDTAEQGLEICEYLVRSSAVDVVVVDSVAALVPKSELEGDMGDTHVGLQARLMSQALRKLTSAISRSNTAVVFINQIREKVGVIWGSPEVTPGGRALKFYSSVRIDLRRIESIKRGTEVIGSRVRGPSSRTRSLRRSRLPSSTSCSTRASAKRATWSSWASPRASSRRAGHSTPSRIPRWARAARTSKCS